MPAAAWLLTLAFAALLACYSVAIPVYRAPDEPAHVDMVRLAAQGQPWPFEGGLRMSQEVTGTFDVVRWSYRGRDDEPPLPRDAAPPRTRRPSFAAAGPAQPSGFSNQMTQHPPLYYELLAGALGAARAVTPGPWPFDQTVGFLRLVSAAMLAPLPLLVWGTARRLGAHAPVGLAAAAVPLGIPVLTHIGAAVSNDTLLTALVGACTWLCARVATGDRSARTATALGVAGGLALLTKGWALFIPGWLAAVYALAAWRAAGADRGRRPRRRPSTPPERTPERTWRPALAMSGAGAVALAVATAIGSPWWLRNLLVLGTVQPSYARPPPAPPGFEPAVGPWLGTLASRLNARFWGEFGWLQASLPEPLMWAATALLGLGVVVAVVRPPDPVRRGVLALLGPFAGILGLVVYGAWTHYAGTGVMALMNGRYLFPAVVGLAVAAAAGWGRLLGRRAQALPLAAATAATAMQALALHTVLVRFWGTPGRDSLRESAAALLAWSPWPPAAVLAASVAAAAVFVLLGVVLVRDVARWRRA